MKLVFTRAANSDIADIENYIARDNVAASRRFVLKLLEACEALVEQPRAYRASGILNLRQRPIGEYLIFYRVTDAIEIVRILHSARDWPHLLDPTL